MANSNSFRPFNKDGTFGDPIPATIRGCYAVHPSKTQKGRYTLSHVPSGIPLFTFRNRGQAMLVASKVPAIDATDLETFKAHPEYENLGAIVQTPEWELEDEIRTTHLKKKDARHQVAQDQWAELVEQSAKLEPVGIVESPFIADPIFQRPFGTALSMVDPFRSNEDSRSDLWGARKIDGCLAASDGVILISVPCDSPDADGTIYPRIEDGVALKGTLPMPDFSPVLRSGEIDRLAFCLVVNGNVLATICTRAVALLKAKAAFCAVLFTLHNDGSLESDLLLDGISSVRLPGTFKGKKPESDLQYQIQVDPRLLLRALPEVGSRTRNKKTPLYLGWSFNRKQQEGLVTVAYPDGLRFLISTLRFEDTK